jgi:catechol 2,3-dioxygenase-like lactoylglutathione lyase family enzyme
VTAIADDPQRNIDFYTGVLGLRLVKVTVNADDHDVYHLHYGDDLGQPGTLLTFYCWPGALRGRPGTGQVIRTGLAVPPGSLATWYRRLRRHRVPVDPPVTRGDVQSLAFRDPDGLLLELVADPASATLPVPMPAQRPTAVSIRGLHGIAIWASPHGHVPTDAFLTRILPGRMRDEMIGVRRYTVGSTGRGRNIEVQEMPGVGRGLTAVGSVHHIAYRVPDVETLALWLAHFRAHGIASTSIRDHVYYHVVGVEEPTGLHVELATDGPGITVDESPAELGTHLVFPPWLEEQRTQIMAQLPPLRLPGAPRGT